MDHKASITALMSSFGRAFHAENERLMKASSGRLRAIIQPFPMLQQMYHRC